MFAGEPSASRLNEQRKKGDVKLTSPLYFRLPPMAGGFVPIAGLVRVDEVQAQQELLGLGAIIERQRATGVVFIVPVVTKFRTN